MTPRVLSESGGVSKMTKQYPDNLKSVLKKKREEEGGTVPAAPTCAYENISPCPGSSEEPGCIVCRS